MRGQIPDGNMKRSDGGCDSNKSMGGKSKTAEKQRKGETGQMNQMPQTSVFSKLYFRTLMFSAVCLLL